MKPIKKETTPARPAGGFDAVKMMRDIRDKISSETQNMSFDDLKSYVNKKIQKSKMKSIGK